MFVHDAQKLLEELPKVLSLKHVYVKVTSRRVSRDSRHFPHIFRSMGSIHPSILL